MSFALIQQPFRPLSKKVDSMKRFALGVVVTAVFILFSLSAATASAASPWWQVLTGSRPTNLWKPSDNVQKITSEIDQTTGALAAKIEVEKTVIGCLAEGS